MIWERRGTRGRGELPEDLLGGLAGMRGLDSAALLDRSGRVLAGFGLPDRDTMTQIAALAAGIHATGSRLGEAVGDSAPARSELGLGTRRVTLSLIPLPAGEPLLLLLVLEGAGPDPESAGSLRAEVDSLARRAASLLQGTVGVQEAEEFEASLDAAVDRLFPERTDP